jgi:hypothetical protein
LLVGEVFVQLRLFASGLVALTFLLLAGGIAVAQQQVDCQGGFNTAKAEYEKRGLAVQSANKRKASAQEACGLFKSLVDAQGKLLKFLQDNKAACNVPEEVLKNIGGSLTKTAVVRTQVCNAAASGGPAAPTPSAGLSGAISITGNVGGPPPESTIGGGLFDTINGNILQR